MRKGWVTKKLSEVCTFFSDGNWIESKDQSDNGYRLIQTGNVGLGDFRNKSGKERFISEDTFSRLKCTEIFKGDILVSRLPDPVGRACIVPSVGHRMITAVDCSILRLNDRIITHDFFKYYSQSQAYFKHIGANISGTTRDRISRKNLGTVPIPIPPLPEQQRIVALLDEAFEAIDQAKANTERNLQNARELFQSELNRIFTNKGVGWVEKKLGEITLKIGSGATPRGGQESYKTDGISLIRSLNVHDDGFRTKDLAFIDDIQANKLSNVEIHKGDVLLNITGASVARCTIVPDNILPARVNQHVSIIRPKKDILQSRFLHFALTSKANKDILLGIGEQGSTRQAITKFQIENFNLSFPKSIDDQQNVVNELDTLSAETKQLEANYQKKLDRLEELKKSILQKAFSGELTRETTEIQMELLDRVAEEQAKYQSKL